jgi:alpha-L-fucosidase
MKRFFMLGVATAIVSACGLPGRGAEPAGPQEFQATSESLMQYRVPQWYNDAKFGIYFHWAPFSVPAYKTEWYPKWMYWPEDKKSRKDFGDIRPHHIEAWGPLDKFGYKDFIPLFKAEKWDPQAWVSLFKEAGAKYLVSAAVHHDGFAMWDSEVIPFNAAAMGPERDVVGEFLAASREAGLKTGVSTHYGRHWSFYTFQPDYDNWDSKYEGLYGHRRGDNDPPRPEDEQHWEDALRELIDKYHPDYIFVDGGIADAEAQFQKPYFRQQFYNVLAHYYNTARQRGQEVVLTYKRQFLDPAQAVEDFERSGMDRIRLESKWQTDDKIAVSGWCFVENTGFWPTDYLIGALADIVSKNGNLLLNVGPRPDGTLREEEVKTLKEIGQWLKINGEAIYGTRPWEQFGEGSTVPLAGDGKNQKEKMGPDAVRFTTKGGALYAICFGWPETGPITIKSLPAGKKLASGEIGQVRMLGVEQPLDFSRSDKGLTVQLPDRKPCDFAIVLKLSAAE